MGVLGVGLAFIGYVLCYAATANHGKFALNPWNGIMGDAYE